MRLFEHEAKALCEKVGLATPPSIRFGRANAPGPTTVAQYLKAQVLSGNRFGNGLVVPVGPGTDPSPAAAAMFAKINKLHQVDDGLLLEESVSYQGAWYVSLTWDRDTREPVVHVRAGGGTGIEGRAAGGFDGPRSLVADTDLATLTIPREAISSFRTMLEKLFDVFVAEELTLFEINPLVWTGSGWCALDAKATTDGRADEAHGRPPRSQTGLMATTWEEKIRAVLESVGSRGTFGMPQELPGDILPLLSGGGASLVAMDALLEVGGRPGAYVEYSGNPAREAVRALASAAMTKSGLKGIWVAGGTANFTDIADTVGGILEAYEASGLSVPIVIRRDGPNADRAKSESESWAASRGVKLVFDRSDVSFLESARKMVEMAY